jgi:hypothetical protein
MKALNNIAQILAEPGWSPFSRRLITLFLCVSAVDFAEVCQCTEALCLGLWGPNAVGAMQHTTLNCRIEDNMDLVFVNTSGQGASSAAGNTRSIWYLTGCVLSGANKIFPELVQVPSPPWRIAAAADFGIADFNGDGLADLVWQNRSTGQIIVCLLKDGVPLDQ